MKKSIPVLIFLFLSSSNLFASQKRDYYVIQIYHCSNQNQIDNIDNYLKNVYLPYLHGKGITKVGVFAPIANDTSMDKKLYL